MAVAPAIDIIDESFVVAHAAELAGRFADPILWRQWWPTLTLTVSRDRGAEGIQWTVGGALAGSAEVWLEPWRDGVIVHWFLRADPVPPRSARRATRLREAYVRDYKRRLTALKDELERDRPCGRPRLERDRYGHFATTGDDAGNEGRAMAEQTTSSISIDAPPADVMAVIADLEAYPEWTASVKQVEILTVYDDEDERPAEARFVLDAGAIKDTYTLSYEWDGDAEVRWTLAEGGLLKALDGSYRLVPVGASSTEVTYQLTVDVAIPLLGLMKRKAEKVIIDTALKELKKRVEG